MTIVRNYYFVGNTVYDIYATMNRYHEQFLIADDIDEPVYHKTMDLFEKMRYDTCVHHASMWPHPRDKVTVINAETGIERQEPLLIPTIEFFNLYGVRFAINLNDLENGVADIQVAQDYERQNPEGFPDLMFFPLGEDEDDTISISIITISDDEYDEIMELGFEFDED